MKSQASRRESGQPIVDAGTTSAGISPEVLEKGEGPVQGPLRHPVAEAFRKFSYFWSMLLLIFALVVTYYDIAQGWTNDFDDKPTHSSTGMVAVNLILFTLLLFWVALLEGAQCSIVGLTSVNIEAFRDTHPQAYRICAYVHSGCNVERLIVGRQFLLLFLVFIISRLGSHNQLTEVTPTGVNGTMEERNQNFYIGEWVWNHRAELITLQNSVLLIIVIIIPGQLVSQLIAAPKMLDFLELNFAPMWLVVYPSLGLESLGITHCAYALRDGMAALSGTEIPDGGRQKNGLYYARVVMSSSLVMFGSICVVYGLLTKQTNATTGPGWDELPGWVALILTLFFGFVIGCCEGFQIAVMRLSKMPHEELEAEFPLACRTIQLLNSGNNLQSFLIGRQVFVAVMMVLLGRVTGFARPCPDAPDGDCIFGFADWFMKGFLQSGIIGAIVVCNIFQLSFRMAATCFPAIFINNHVMYLLLRITLVVESTGVVNACWPLAWFIDWLFGCKPDVLECIGNGKAVKFLPGVWKPVPHMTMALAMVAMDAFRTKMAKMADLSEEDQLLRCAIMMQTAFRRKQQRRAEAEAAAEAAASELPEEKRTASYMAHVEG